MHAYSIYQLRCSVSYYYAQHRSETFVLMMEKINKYLLGNDPNLVGTIVAFRKGLIKSKYLEYEDKAANLHPSIFSHARAASLRSAKLINAKPFALCVSLSRARKTRVTRPNRSKRSRSSCSSANSDTQITVSPTSTNPIYPQPSKQGQNSRS